MAATTRIDEEVHAFLGCGTTCIVASSNEHGVPELSMALACWPAGPDCLDVVLDSEEAAALLTLLRRGAARVAMVASRPGDLTTLQFKGSEVSFPPVDAAVLAQLALAQQRLHQAFRGIGLADAYVTTLLHQADERLVRLRFVVEAIFDQTPGPSAGKPKACR